MPPPPLPGPHSPGPHSPGPGARPARLRVLLLAHGYPERETAGTEQHVATLARALHARGHEVQVVAATRDPARRPWSWIEDRDPAGFPVRRLVQNVAVRPLAQAERDAVVEEAVYAAAEAWQPDLVHVHHLQFLSAGLRFSAPTVLTLHDQWLWCAAGGLGVLPGSEPCPGPDPARCAPCAAQWAPRPSRAAGLLVRTAGALAPLLPAERQHRAWSRLPAGLRQRLQRPRRGAAAEPAEAARARNAAMADFARACALRLSPSEDLARRARAAGLGEVEVLPHGVPPLAPGQAPAERKGPVLFLGTIAAHKGPDLVVSAWRRAFPEGQPGLALHGPVQDPALALGHPVGPVLDRAGVARALAEARVLVLGSRWPENAPLVVSEARASGCPVIAPAIGGLPELVEPGVDGWLYPPGDEAALADCLQRAVQAPLPRPPRPPPSLDAWLDAVLSAYDRVLGARERR